MKTENVVAEHGRQKKCIGGGFEEKIIEIKSRQSQPPIFIHSSVIPFTTTTIATFPWFPLFYQHDTHQCIFIVFSTTNTIFLFFYLHRHRHQNNHISLLLLPPPPSPHCYCFPITITFLLFSFLLFHEPLYDVIL